MDQMKANVRPPRWLSQATVALLAEPASRQYDVPLALVMAVCQVESNFDAHAVSPVGAEGLMQLMPDTARAMGVTDSFDPALNVMGGTKYLRHLADKELTDRSMLMCVAAYNAGPTRIRSAGRDTARWPQETRDYVRRVAFHFINFSRVRL